MDLGQKFDIISKRMRIDFEDIRNSINHPGEKGRSSEEIVRKFLKKYFPKTLDISTGFIIDSNGNESKQIDIIIHDATRTPIFFEDQSIRILPVECVYSVIEVKTQLDSSRLGHSFENMKSVRKLEKKAYVRSPPFDQFSVKAYGSEWPIWPINYYIFAFDSMDLKDISSTMERKYTEEELPVHSRIDTICVLDKGVIYNCLSDGQIDALPEPNSKLEYFLTPRALLLFYGLISSHLLQAQLPFIQLHDYVAKFV